VEQSIGVFGEDVILWACVLRQASRRPGAAAVLQQANYLLNELKASRAAQELPVQAADDAMFAITALIDEIAMGLSDLRPVWAASPLQATRWMTNNAGAEVFDRLERSRRGPRPVVAAFAAVLGVGYHGRFGLPGADRYALMQLRRQLAHDLGVDPERDWKGGVLRPTRADQGPSALAPKEEWWRSLAFGRALAVLAALAAAATFAGALWSTLA
jgi:type VI secretion system protein ImpK